jgi:5'-nucleotidase
MGKILIVNDDGINAPGLKFLIAALKEYELLIVAPECEQSGAGHAITIKTPLTFKEVKSKFDHPSYCAYSVKGTPADCTKLGMFYFSRPEEIELVISGINNGLNVGVDIYYSGTVAGAREASFSGKKAVSLSSFSGSSEVDFQKVASVFKNLVPVLLKNEMEGFFLNRYRRLFCI